MAVRLLFVPFRRGRVGAVGGRSNPGRVAVCRVAQQWRARSSPKRLAPATVAHRTVPAGTGAPTAKQLAACSRTRAWARSPLTG